VRYTCTFVFRKLKYLILGNNPVMREFLYRFRAVGYIYSIHSNRTSVSRIYGNSITDPLLGFQLSCSLCFSWLHVEIFGLSRFRFM